MKNLSAVYFSPTGGTRKAVLNLAAGMGGDIEEVDLCALKGERGFGPEDLVIVGMPVFGGRIPGFAAKLLKQCRGNGATAVTVAVYGNRAFEDALVELNDALKELGFKIGASAALLAEHSMAREVAAGRPDKKDEEDARGFAGKILEKLAGDGWQEAKVPGDRPYRSWKQMPVVPLADDTCITCGLCAEQCPTGAIPADAPGTTDPGACMLCMRCIAVCPVHARSLPSQAQAMLEQKQSLGQLVKDVDIYPQILENVKVRDKKDAREDADVITAVEAVEKELGNDGRILVRESGTEPLVRVMVEAKTHEICREHVDRVVKVLRQKGHVID